MKEEDLHYLGGLFDGDGSFTIEVSKHEGYALGFDISPSVVLSQSLAAVEWTDSPAGDPEMHYLGGIFDAEGFFGISIGKRTDVRFGYRMKPTVEVNMKTEEGENPTRELVEQLFQEAGSEGETHLQEMERGSSDQWIRNTSGAPALALMDILSPYLRLKEEQTRLIRSVEWDSVQSSREAFLEAAKVRDELRGGQGNFQSKYDYETLEELIETGKHEDAMEEE